MDELDPLYDAFEKNGGCGHDLPLSGLIAILHKWEQIRPYALKLIIISGYTEPLIYSFNPAGVLSWNNVENIPVDRIVIAKDEKDETHLTIRPLP